MVRGLLGGLAALMLVAAGIFWWQGRAATGFGGEAPVLAVDTAPEAEPEEELPYADAEGLTGVAPPEATEVGRETKRFNMLDKDRDNRITRNEMLSTRSRDFRKLDKDGNNLLTFEEWAHTTVDKFKFADSNSDLWLSREEFATTRPKPRPKPTQKCVCK